MTTLGYHFALGLKLATTLPRSYRDVFSDNSYVIQSTVIDTLDSMYFCPGFLPFCTYHRNENSEHHTTNTTLNLPNPQTHLCGAALLHLSAANCLTFIGIRSCMLLNARKVTDGALKRSRPFVSPRRLSNISHSAELQPSPFIITMRLW